MSISDTSTYHQNHENGGIDYVSNLLNEWDLAVLQDTFEENDIGISSLKYLKDSDIKELIPKVGQRCLFYAKLEEWRLAQSLSKQTKTPTRTAIKRKYSHNSTSNADMNPPSSIVKLEEPEITESLPTNNVPDIIFIKSHTLDHNLAFQYNNVNSNEFSVFEWLSHDADGQCILDTYNVVNGLGIEQCKTVLKTITKWMVDQKLPKSPAVLEKMSTQLMDLFPTEHFSSNDLLRWVTQIENGIEPDVIKSSKIVNVGEISPFESNKINQCSKNHTAFVSCQNNQDLTSMLNIILNNQTIIIENQNSLQKRMTTLEKKIDNNARDLLAQNKIVRENKVISHRVHKSMCRMTGETADDTLIDIASTLPIATLAACEEVEEKLKSLHYENAMKTYFFQMRGKSESLDNILKEIFTDEFAEECNADGRKGKKSLLNTTLVSRTLFDIFENEGRLQFENAVRKFVRMSHNRCKQRRYQDKIKNV